MISFQICYLKFPGVPNFVLQNNPVTFSREKNQSCYANMLYFHIFVPEIGYHNLPGHMIPDQYAWLGYVVSNHGDRKSPITGVGGPLPNGLNGWVIPRSGVCPPVHVL